MSRVKTSRAGWLFVLLAIFCLGEAPSGLEHQQPADLGPFFAKRQVTIAVTDSGLGGLSIMAEAAARLKEAKIFEKADFVFFNALFSNESGYNSLKTRAEKTTVFDSALESLEKNYRPDLILIGCNTLSVLYPETFFSTRTKIPVVGIVDAGVAMSLKALLTNPAASLILFGTETTIGEGEHKRKLMEAGIPEKRIIAQACPELAGYIENGYQSDETGLLIESAVEEALAKLTDPKVPIYAGLVCTHYGYSLSLWNKAFEERGRQLLGILNPNSRMLDFLFESGDKNRARTTKMSARVVSMVEIAENKRKSLAGWLDKVSPEVASALTKYELKPNLFKWQDPRRGSKRMSLRACPGQARR
ncbi:MAG: aspartate/glutamate racemase family protein [Candidatus Aminicenantes bacterium]|nr:aspartate/glutamate racemase family protein [Candidatus Aminicenantes bacterium]